MVFSDKATVCVNSTASSGSTGLGAPSFPSTVVGGGASSLVFSASLPRKSANARSPLAPSRNGSCARPRSLKSRNRAGVVPPSSAVNVCSSCNTSSTVRWRLARAKSRASVDGGCLSRSATATVRTGDRPTTGLA
ncbi:hypothetical protein D9M68_646900 [compost metagenome]